jgi:hypothetical protein
MMLIIFEIALANLNQLRKDSGRVFSVHHTEKHQESKRTASLPLARQRPKHYQYLSSVARLRYRQPSYSF